MNVVNGSRISLFLLFLIGIMACKMDNNGVFSAAVPERSGNIEQDTTSNRPIGNKLTIIVGNTPFTATLLDNPTVTAFKARLPMTVSMIELNGNEKYYNFLKDLPASASNPGTVQPGDLMLYGSNTLVLFYQSFPTSYRYTKLGRIDNPAGLAAALGSGSVTTTFTFD